MEEDDRPVPAATTEAEAPDGMIAEADAADMIREVNARLRQRFFQAAMAVAERDARRQAAAHPTVLGDPRRMIQSLAAQTEPQRPGQTD